MNYYLNELSKGLLQRAAEKARKHSKMAKRVGMAHAKMGILKDEPGSDPMTNPKLRDMGPHIQTTLLAAQLHQQRKEQSQKFHVASKGVRTRRPGRGYPLGVLTRDVAQRSHALRRDFGIEEGSRSIKRLMRKMAAGHLDPSSPTIRAKFADTLGRRVARETGEHPSAREKNLRAAMGAVQAGTEELSRRPSNLQKMTPAELDAALDDRPIRAERATRRAHNRSIGSFEPGRDQPGVVRIIARQRKEEFDPVRDTKISRVSRGYRLMRKKKVPPSMN